MGITIGKITPLSMGLNCSPDRHLQWVTKEMGRIDNLSTLTGGVGRVT